MLIRFLGLCPALAVTASVKNAAVMGAAVIAVMIISGLTVSLLRPIIPPGARVIACLAIISVPVTAAELFIRAYFPDFESALGVFIPLIAVNCLILDRTTFAAENPPAAAALDGVLNGLGYAAALIAVAAFREILGAGSFFGISLFGGGFKPAALFAQPSGAFLILGFAAAGMKAMVNKSAVKAEKRAAEGADESENNGIITAEAVEVIETETVVETETKTETDVITETVCGESIIETAETKKTVAENGEDIDA